MIKLVRVLLLIISTSLFATSSTMVVDSQILSGNDDAEENLINGQIGLNSSDLELIQDKNKMQIVGMRFQNITIPQGVTITKAYLQFTAKEKNNNEQTDLIIQGELTPNANTFSYDDFNISSRLKTLTSVEWNSIPEWVTRKDKLEAQKSSDIKAIIQEIVNQNSWKNNNALVLIISGTGKRSAVAYNGKNTEAPILHIEYETIGNEPIKIDSQISSGDDDAEENLANGQVGLNSSDLELTQDKDKKQIIGMRFQNIVIPQGVTITKAYIQFTAKERDNSEQTDLIIWGELTPNATTFSYDNSNISLREKTVASVEWNSIPEWISRREKSEAQKSSDIKDIIQEIINQDAWENSNALVLMISGEGKRVATSYNKKSTEAPILYIEYLDSGSENPCISISDLKNKIANNEDVREVNTGCITDMSELFRDNSTFNQDISDWDVSNVEDMHFMFLGASSFNQNIGLWDVSKVTNMQAMFSGAVSFEQDIGFWDVTNVTNMSVMFYQARKFNGDIGSWNVNNVTDMTTMFAEALVFNQDISSWNVDNVNSMALMFYVAMAFNQDISSWSVDSVTSMLYMFAGAREFNQDISSWSVDSVTDMTGMFYNALNFSNQNLTTWSVSGVVAHDDFLTGAGLGNIEPNWSKI